MSEREEQPVERRPTPNRSAGRGGERPRAIVVHTTVGSFESTAGWFAQRKSGVSAHYLVGLDGRVAQFVDEEDTARHAGRVLRASAAIARDAGEDGANPFTIGIEFEDGGDPFGVERPAAQYEAGAGLIAGIAARWEIALSRESVIGHREIFAAKECPGNLDLERLLARAREIAGGRARAAAGASRPGGESGPPSLLCLLPARDAAADVPGYLESVAALGAGLVALDDGSGDETAELLARSPLVKSLLRNPLRSGYGDWDDGANRRRLLAAAAELAPDWVLFLDADERIDADDAAALRGFVGGDALPGLAYGLQLFREWEGRVVAKPTCVYRLFGHDPAHELRAGRMHFNPVPRQIPRRAWVQTTIRARHLDSPERLERRRAKYAQADPDGVDTGATGELLRAPVGPFARWGPRPAGLPALATAAGPASAEQRPVPGAGADGPGLVCLLPARNCAPDLPGYFESAERFADAVIALDDGSTDETARLLDEAPRVIRTLRNPVRESYAGWNDAANRQALLDAAIAAGARWALFLDADERIDPGDASVLREFVEREADPGCAYGFRVHRMAGDMETYDRAELWVYRLFAPRPGQRLPSETLHLVPVPESIPRARWLQTTIRIQHLAGLDAKRRAARIRKYEEADPQLRWQRDYRKTLSAAGSPRPWQRRPDGLPPLADPLGSGVAVDLEDHDAGAPVLSAIVIATDDEATIERSVRAVVDQQVPEAFEVIVVVSGSPETAAIVRRSFGEDVRLVELADRATPGAARNAGLRIARGEYVSFPGSHVEIAPGSLARRLQAHEQGWAMVTGSIVNGNTSPAGWASYFLDHSSALPGRPSAELPGAPAHCSYVREFLLEAGGFAEDMRAGEDTAANQRLWRQGYRAFREQGIRLTHRSPCSTRWKLVRHHFVRGVAFGRILREGPDGGKRAPASTLIRLVAGYPRRRLRVTDQRVAEWGGELRTEYAGVRGLVVLGVVASWAGTWAGLFGAG